MLTRGITASAVVGTSWQRLMLLLRVPGTGKSSTDLRSGWDAESLCQNNLNMFSENRPQNNSCPMLDNCGTM